MLTLYSIPDTCAMAVHIALQWSGLPYRVQILKHGENHDLDYLAINPLGSVPALVLEDGTILTEAAALLAYIHDVAGDAFQAPRRTALGRAELATHLSFFTSELHPAFGPHFKPDRFSPDPDHHQDLRDQAEQRIAFLLDHAEQAFEGPFLFGEHRSVADPYLFVLCNWIGMTRIDLEDYPKLASFRRHMTLDPDVSQALNLYD